MTLAEIAPQLIDRLGFLHVPGRPGASGQAYLIVALRRLPTLEHFDPERIDYWQVVEGRGVPEQIDHSSQSRREAPFAWGAISFVDRKGIANYFVSFGGKCTVERSLDEMVAIFSSPGPIAACGGHSQGFDFGAGEMSAFVGRLRAAAGASHALEARICGEPPLAIYSAFVADALWRHRDPHGAPVGDERVLEMLRSERRWLVATAGHEWATGIEVARSLS
jgi:hypothetical protein